MTAVIVKALADLRRRRVQAAVIFVTVLLSMAAGTIALTLMSQTRDPYQAAFDKQRGAHLQIAFSATTDPQVLAKTPATIGATAAGGPYPISNIQFKFGDRKFNVDALGCGCPYVPVEILNLTSGLWVLANDEIFLTRSFAELNNISVGARLKVTSVVQTPTLTVVGEVVDIDEGSADLSSQRAWVMAAAVPALSTPDSAFYLMDYRFAADPTAAQLTGYVDQLRASLPPGSISGSLNYILVGSIFNITNQILTGVLSAFSVFALAATIAIVATLVTGIVISAYREIGIMKSIGFMPSQVVGVFALQILIPAVVACVLGIAAGTAASQPLLANSSHALGLGYTPAYSVGLDLALLAGGLLVVAVAAIVPALRAGLLKPIAAIAKASAPRGASGRILRSAAARARLPRPIILGLGDAFARPLRAILTLVTVLLGVSTVVVAVGLPRSFVLINNPGRSLFMDLATMASVKPAVEPFYYDVTLAPGADVSSYVRRVAAAQPDLIDVHASDTSIITPVKIIDLVLLILAGVLALIGIGGVFNTLLLNTRERIRDTATLKALGMSPRQVIAMVAASAALLALVGGLVAMPVGLVLHHVLNDVISSSAGNDTPPGAYAVFNPIELVLIPLLGMAVAVVAALIPGRWAARTNVVEVLHAE